jgi:hypothetical protein
MASSPVAYWRLGEPSGATAADSSGAGNTGTISGGVTLGQPGALLNDGNTAMTFNGSTGWITVPETSNLDPTQDFTIEAWVKPNVLNGTAQTIVHKGAAGCDTGYQYRLMISSSNQWRGVVCGQTTFTGYQVVDTTDVPSTTQWTYLALVRSGTSLNLYVNGQAAAQPTTISESNRTSTFNLNIGHFADSTASFNGGIDEVAFYNYALSPTTIQNHYHASGR